MDHCFGTTIISWLLKLVWVSLFLFFTVLLKNVLTPCQFFFPELFLGFETAFKLFAHFGTLFKIADLGVSVWPNWDQLVQLIFQT